MQGRRLNDTPMGDFPRGPRGGLQRRTPGSYWKMLNRQTGKPLDVHTLRDQRWWNNTGSKDPKFDQNLTGTVWGVIDPVGRYGMLSVHTVREHEDGTISVRPGDGSSNSILISGGSETAEPWHGYIEHGVWHV
jgi:hypothetical protein